MQVGRRPLSVLESPDGKRFRVRGCIGTIDKRGRAFAVRWKEAEVVSNEDGVETRRYRKRRRAVSNLGAAVALLLEVNASHDAGRVYSAPRERPMATVGAIAMAYVRTSAEGRPASTARFRATLLQRFLDWSGDERRVGDLTTGLLSEYATFLRGEGIGSVSRYVAQVEQLWTWAWNRSDTFPGVPEPRKVTGRDGDLPHRVEPVATDTPTWAEVDAMIAALTPEGCAAWLARRRAAGESDLRGFGYRPQWRVHWQVAVVQRFTGLRVSQIASLMREDLDLERERLVIRAGRVGAKGQRRDRVVPMHPELARVLGEWELPDEGVVFGRVATKGPRRGERIALVGAEVADVFTRAWERAGVPKSRWGAVGGRNNARPTNAIRARWKSTIAGASSYELAAMMVGQASRGEHDAYVALGNPEASPYWDAMTGAVASIPTSPRLLLEAT